MLPIEEAAMQAYADAKREGMTIAWVAENARDAQSPVDWFARSIAGVVPVFRKSGAAYEPAAAGADPGSLYIRKQDYRTYIDWARTMQ